MTITISVLPTTAVYERRVWTDKTLLVIRKPQVATDTTACITVLRRLRSDGSILQRAAISIIPQPPASSYRTTAPPASSTIACGARVSHSLRSARSHQNKRNGSAGRAITQVEDLKKGSGARSFPISQFFLKAT